MKKLFEELMKEYTTTMLTKKELNDVISSARELYYDCETLIDTITYNELTPP